MSDPGTDTYTTDDGATYGADGGLLAFPAGTPSATSFDGDQDGYDEYAVSDHDHDGRVDEVVLDTDADGYGDAAITDGGPYGEHGPVAVADTDGDTYADVVAAL